MSIRTTVTLDDDLLARLQQEARHRGAPFRETLNDVLRQGLRSIEQPPIRRQLKIEPVHMGVKAGLNYDKIEALLEYGEGERHR